MKKIVLIKKTALFILLSASLSSCATLEKWHQDWLAENCNPNKAFTNGLTDGLKPSTMPNDYSRSCPAHQIEISDAYLKGFSKGLRNRPEEVHVSEDVNVHQHEDHKHKHRHH